MHLRPCKFKDTSNILNTSTNFWSEFSTPKQEEKCIPKQGLWWQIFNFLGTTKRSTHDQKCSYSKYPPPFRWRIFWADVYWTVQQCDNWRIKNQLDATYYFIELFIGSTCFGHYYAHHQELTTIMLITTLVVSFLVYCRLEVRCG